MIKALAQRFKILRASYWRLNRLFFPSPAEVRFIEILGGKVIRAQFIKHHKTGFPLAIYWNLGKLLKSEKFRREVRIKKFWVDFGNDIMWAIDIDGREYHSNVVAQFDRDSYIYQQGWRTYHVPAIRLWSEPAKVQIDVLKFFYGK